MVGQGIQKHNPDSIDEGYITHSPTPINHTHLEDDVFDTTSLSELHIIEEDSEGSCSTKHNKNIDESEGEDHTRQVKGISPNVAPFKVSILFITFIFLEILI